MRQPRKTVLSDGHLKNQSEPTTQVFVLDRDARTTLRNLYRWLQALALQTALVAPAFAVNEVPIAPLAHAKTSPVAVSAQPPAPPHPSEAIAKQTPAATGVLTLERLANAQRQKLAAELEKGKSTNEVRLDNANPSLTKASKPKAPNEPVARGRLQTLVVVATYGTPANPRAEVQWNGVTRVVGPKAALGPATIEAISHGQVRVTLVQQQKPVSYALQPGERLDF